MYRKLFGPCSIPSWIHIHSRTWRRKASHGESLNLAFLMHCYSQQNCTDPRDKVYALLGISTEYKDVEMEIDYKASVREIYMTAARYIIMSSNRLDLLLFAGCHAGGLSTSLSTWAPDVSINYFPLPRSFYRNLTLIFVLQMYNNVTSSVCIHPMLGISISNMNMLTYCFQ